MPIVDIDAVNSGTLYGSGFSPNTYTPVHNGTNNPYAIDSQGPVVGQDYYSGDADFEVYRGAVEFSTATILGAVTAATLSLYGKLDFSTTDFNITIVSGSNLANPLVNGDYIDLLATTTSFGELTTAGFGVESFNVIALNATGIAALKAAIRNGVARFGLRSSRDISSTNPKQDGGDWYESVYFYGAGDDAKKPKLSVTYSETGEEQGLLAVVGETLHYLSKTGLEYVIQGGAIP